MRYGKSGLSFAALFCALAAAGCSGGGNSSTGTVSFSLMDRPVDGVTALYVTIDEIWIKPRGDGPAFPLPMTSTPLTVDLLSLTDRNAAVLVDEAVVDAGTYNWVELKIDDSDLTKSYAMTVTGGLQPVDIDVPSDRIRLVSGFEVGENQAVRLLFDWEVGTGLTEAVGRDLYILKPAFRVLRADEYGAISGKLTSATATANADCNNMDDKLVYLFEGALTLDEINAVPPEPVTTADAKYNADGDFEYRAVVMPGTYTVALTCLPGAGTDGDNDRKFLSPLGDAVVTVTAATPVEGVDF